jgi:hypothetical protein
VPLILTTPCILRCGPHVPKGHTKTKFLQDVGWMDGWMGGWVDEQTDRQSQTRRINTKRRYLPSRLCRNKAYHNKKYHGREKIRSDPIYNTLLIGMLPENTNHIPNYSWHKTLRLQSPDIHTLPGSGYDLMTWQGCSPKVSPLLNFCD